MIYVPYWCCGQCFELSLKLTYNFQVARFPLFSVVQKDDTAMLGFSLSCLCLQCPLAALCGALLLMSRWVKWLPRRTAKPCFSPFKYFPGISFHFSDYLQCCYQQLYASFKPRAALVCQQASLAVPLAGQAGSLLAGAYLCTQLMIQDFSTASLLFT